MSEPVDESAYAKAGRMFFDMMEAMEKSGVSSEVSRDEALNGYVAAYLGLKEENIELQQRAEKAERLVEAYRAEYQGNISVHGRSISGLWKWISKTALGSYDGSEGYDTREEALLAALTELEKK